MPMEDIRAMDVEDATDLIHNQFESILTSQPERLSNGSKRGKM
jgi:hypothetical protein